MGTVTGRDSSGQVIARSLPGPCLGGHNVSAAQRRPRARRGAGDALHESVAEAYEAGRFAGPGPIRTSRGLWASVHGLASMMVARSGFPWPEPVDFVDLVAETAVYGLIPR